MSTSTNQLCSRPAHKDWIMGTFESQPDTPDMRSLGHFDLGGGGERRRGGGGGEGGGGGGEEERGGGEGGWLLYKRGKSRVSG